MRKFQCPIDIRDCCIDVPYLSTELMQADTFTVLTKKLFDKLNKLLYLPKKSSLSYGDRKEAKTLKLPKCRSQTVHTAAITLANWTWKVTHKLTWYLPTVLSTWEQEPTIRDETSQQSPQLKTSVEIPSWKKWTRGSNNRVRSCSDEDCSLDNFFEYFPYHVSLVEKWNKPFLLV